MEWEPDGRRRKVKRRRNWINCVQDAMNDYGLQQKDAEDKYK